MNWRKFQTAERPPWKLLLWATVMGLVFGLIGFGEIAEDWLRVARNSLHKHPASGQFIFVRIDDKALRTVGNWPWPRSTDAKLVDRLTDAGAKKILLDINLAFPTTASEDRALADSIRSSGRVALFTRWKSGPNGASKRVDDRPHPMFAQHAELGLASVPYNYQNAVWNLPYSVRLGDQNVRSFASLFADVTGNAGSSFPLDYSVDVNTIPTYSAGDVLSGRVPNRAFAGKSVIFGAGTDILNDVFFLPGYGRGFGAQVQIVGAETLIQGAPTRLGWALGFILAVVLAAIASMQSRSFLRYGLLAVGIVALVTIPAFLEVNLIFVDITPGLFVILTVLFVQVWQRLRSEGLKNSITGLPNLNALRQHGPGRKQALVAARVLNYEDALATLAPGSERRLVEQIVTRLSVGATERIIYQGDSGIFAWFADPRHPFGNHLEALHALFRNPARVNDLSVDLSIAFGVEVGSKRSLDSRLASALVAADQAARDGLKWCYHDPDTLEDAAWRLSILSQLDSAIDKGEVWIAYQPKLDLATKSIVGAEALARWTHPEKGPIAASEFVAAAEQNNRIAKLTDFVLDQAIKAAAEINRKDGEFEVAVNMSARLMSDKQFLLRLSAALARHGLAPRHLTLELTETAALASAGEGLAMIGQLRDMGVRISIDDYGTGMSTLDYLKRVPASEIKIDQSFVRGIADNRSDRLMVHSTIQLAHSLGRRVVAEGVEEREIVDVLVELGCDIGQGYALGRPMSLESLMKRLASNRKRSVA